MTSKRKKNRTNHSRPEEPRYTVRGIRRDPLDIGKLSKALLGLAMADAERQAQAEQAARTAADEVATKGPQGQDAR